MIAPTIATILVVALLAQGWLLVQARAQQDRVRARIDILSTRITARSFLPARPSSEHNPLVGKRAPEMALATLYGEIRSLRSLLSPAGPLMLVFVEPRCGPCYELLPDIAGWQRVYGDRLSIALISAGDPQQNFAMTAEYGIEPVLLQRELELVSAFELAQAPAAILIESDGVISAGPSYGVFSIRQLVAETLGLALPEPPILEQQTVSIGVMAPSIRRPDLSGSLIDFAAFRGVPTLLLFWNPGCSHCQELRPMVRTLEQLPKRPRLVVISRGPIGLNKDMGFISPVVLDDDRSIAGTFGVTGTPAAVLIDEMGIVVSRVARGEAGVRALLTSGMIPTPLLAG